MITKNELKKIKSLHQKKYRDSENKFLIEGIHLVEEALNSNVPIELVMVTPEFQEKNSDLFNVLKNKNIVTENIHKKDLDSISDTITPQGILAVIKKHTLTIDQILNTASISKEFYIVALDEVSDPGNLGTIIRTSDWFGINAMLLSNSCVDIFNPKVIRATMGSIFHLQIVENLALAEVLAYFRKLDFKIYSATLKGENYRDVKINPRSIIIFGQESIGIKEELINLSDKSVTIPGKGKSESLNVSVSAGIILSALLKG